MVRWCSTSGCSASTSRTSCSPQRRVRRLCHGQVLLIAQARAVTQGKDSAAVFMDIERARRWVAAGREGAGRTAMSDEHGKGAAGSPAQLLPGYTGVFIALILVLALLERHGLPPRWIGYAFLFSRSSSTRRSAS